VCQLLFFFGTFAPFFRASDKPIAMACFLLLTVPPFPPLPDLRVPLFFRFIALLTLLPAALPYLAIFFAPPESEGGPGGSRGPPSRIKLQLDN